ncbi:MAG: Rne/Rng family ribonuclease, partial [Candidatus Poribacteria bacterium]|nr:Rne/Rng family ribonuclease [Candidatus Poribacteria bacterium]
ERKDAEHILNNIYKGRVETVLPGMQIAFVDIGVEKHAFLHISDINPDFEEDGSEKNSAKLDLSPNATGSPRMRRGYSYSISDLIQKDQEILVQVGKEPMGTKGPRVTTGITLPGRYVVYLPTASRIGVSRRIESPEERQRLREIAEAMRADIEGGFIIRTAAEGKSEAEFSTEIQYLINQWQKINGEAEKISAPNLVHKDLGFTVRILRDQFTQDVKQFIIDSKEQYQFTLDYLSSALPELRSRVQLYDKSTPIFEAYGIDKELKKALSEKIWLKCGGYIVIQQTEAMVSIDVNTGKFVGKADPDNTILSANLEAVEEVVRQLRLRDIGGIIVIDFIDMDYSEHRQMVFKMLQQALNTDRARTNLLHISELGLVEMTRQRTRPSLATVLTESCPYCDGYGSVLSIDTITIDLLRAIKNAYRRSRKRRLKVIASEHIISHLLDDKTDKLGQLEKSMRLRIQMQGDADLHLEDYRIFDQDTNREIYLN